MFRIPASDGKADHRTLLTLAQLGERACRVHASTSESASIEAFAWQCEGKYAGCRIFRHSRSGSKPACEERIVHFQAADLETPSDMHQRAGRSMEPSRGQGRNENGGALTASAPPGFDEHHPPDAAASIVFWIFSRLKEPGDWLGGYSFIVIRNLPASCCSGTIT